MGMNGFTGNDIKAVFAALDTVMAANRDRLIEMDAAIGDGDLGITMSRGFSEASAALRDEPADDPGKLLMKAGMVIAKTAPSTMGTLIATGFMRGGKVVSGTVELNTGAMAVFFEAFAAGIMERGGAKPGEKTILDTLVPVSEALQRADGEGVPLGEALQSALVAAESGAESAKAMRAVHGRPSYYGNRSVGHEDPGARVGVLIVGVFAAHAAGA